MVPAIHAGSPVSLSQGHLRFDATRLPRGQEADGHQQSQRPTLLLDEILVQPGYEHAHTFVESVLTGEGRGDGRHLSLDRAETETGVEPAVALERPRPNGSRVCRIDGQRRVRVRLHQPDSKSLGCNANDRERALRDRQPSSKNARITAKPTLPEAV